MRFTDIFLLAIQNLWRYKTRACLNLIGIVISCAALLLTTTGAAGVRGAIQAIFDSSDFAREISVRGKGYIRPDPPEGAVVVEGAMSPERRERMQELLEEAWRTEHQTPGPYGVAEDDIEKLRAIASVDRVVPSSFLDCTSGITVPEVEGTLVGLDAKKSTFADRVIFGEMLEEGDTEGAIVNELHAYKMGFKSDADLANLIGKRITIRRHIQAKLGNVYTYLAGLESDSATTITDQIQFASTINQLATELDKTSLTDRQKELFRSIIQIDRDSKEENNAPKGLERECSFIVRGVVRNEESSYSMFKQWFMGEFGDLFVNHAVAAELQLEDPDLQEFAMAKVIVDSTRNLREVTDAIKELNLEADSAIDILEQLNWQIDHGRWVLYLIIAAVLVASAIGISNTLIMSVVQRTPEIGIMKAVGAKDSDLLKLMLVEGALLGIVGATIAFCLGATLVLFGHRLLAYFLQSQFGELQGTLFQFSLTSILSVYAVAIVVCVAASIVPAWRAARLDPVVSMRRT